MKQQSTTLKQEELLNTQRNAESNHNKNSTLVERNKIEGTPFYLLKNNNEYFITYGKYRITEPTTTEEETLKKLESEKWLITMHMIIIIIEMKFENPIIHEME